MGLLELMFLLARVRLLCPDLPVSCESEPQDGSSCFIIRCNALCPTMLRIANGVDQTLDKLKTKDTFQGLIT